MDFIFLKFIRAVKVSLVGGIGLGYCDMDFFYDTEKQFSKILEDIDNGPPEPFFAWTHLFSPHEPYLPPEPFEGMFGSSLKLKGENLSREEIRRHSILTSEARYDEYIRYVDEKFKEFIEDLRLKNKMKNTVIILSSDHGHGNPDLSELRVNIPLIIKEPDNREGRIINDLVEQIDIPATILDLAHIPIPDWIEGRSLVPLMYGKMLPPKPIFSMYFVTNPVNARITKGTIAIWDYDYKLLHNLDNDKSLLFNLKEDPDEQNNLFDKETETGQHLLGVVLDNLEEVNERFSKVD